MTTEGSEVTKTRATDEPSRPRAKVCKLCCDLPDRRELPTCPECGRASTAKLEVPLDPVWYVPPPPAPLAVVETMTPKRRLAPMGQPRKVILPQGYIDAAESVAVAHGYTLGDLRSSSRNASLIRVRREAMATVRALGASYPETGALFNRDHTSVMNLLRVTRRWRVAV